MKAVRVAVVGLGRIGKVHAVIYKSKVPEARLVAVVDVVESLARSMGEKLHVDWHTDYAEVLKREDVDAVVICTPTYLHADMVVQAAEAGKHVFCEKPMTLTVADAEKCVKAAEKAGVKLQVGYMRRFDDMYRRAKERIDSGELGKPYLFVGISGDPAPPPGWVADPKLSGGLFLDLMSHDFDIGRWLMGSEVSEVYVAAGAYVYSEVKEKGDVDAAIVLVKFRSGAIGVFRGSRNSFYGYDIRAEVHGDKGIALIGCSVDHSFAFCTSEGVFMRGFPWFSSRFYDAYMREDVEFAKCIVEDREPPVTGVDGLRAVEIAEACWKSIRESKPISLS